MLVGVGIDILSLSRFASLLARRSPELVAKRICSPIELRAFGKEDESAVLRFLSTRSVAHRTVRIRTCGLTDDRWVLKEAAYKALSARYAVTWKSLEVDHSPSRQPVVRYIRPNATNSTGGLGVAINTDGIELMCTLSHDAGVVVGVVIAQKV